MGYGTGGYGANGYGGTPTFSEPISYYLSLITSQYQNSPKFLAWVAGEIQPFADIATCLYSMYQAFSLGAAQGVQLDTLGEIIGVSRTLPFTPRFSVSPILTDAAYLVLLQATIGANFWNGTIDGLQSLWRQLFPGGQITITDHQDMTVTVILSGHFSTVIQDMITNGMIVPRPEGVLMNYTFANLPIFGFDLSDAFIAGFDLGNWS